MKKVILVLVLLSCILVLNECKIQRLKQFGSVNQFKSIKNYDFEFRQEGSPENKLSVLDVNDHLLMLDEYKKRFHLSDVENSIDMKIKIFLEKIDTAEDFQDVNIEEEKFQIEIDVQGQTSFKCVGYVSFLRALETFARMINKNGTINKLPLKVIDGPSIAWRGLSIDTARYFYPMSYLKNVVVGMQLAKLNIFHWHISDSESFPFQLKKYPKVTEYGAFSPKDIYTQEDIKDFISFANARGVIVIPEIDQPAHVRSWTLSPEFNEINTCLNYPPSQWAQYCVEPPCGQLNPSLDKTYDLAGQILTEVQDLFGGQYIHLGGDEINDKCWDSNEQLTAWKKQNNIKNNSELFNYYFQKLNPYVTQNRKKIFWFNAGMEGIKYPNNSIIQFWGDTNMYNRLKEFTEKVILSTVDFLYFDCGTGNQLGDQTWCNPFKSWNHVYNFNPNQANLGDRLFGVEAPAWSEMIPPDNLDFKLWPRGTALGMKLWNTDEHLSKPELVSQLVYTNNLMLSLGIQVGPVSNEYCERNINMCFF